jgi:hypothetical protein
MLARIRISIIIFKLSSYITDKQLFTPHPPHTRVITYVLFCKCCLGGSNQKAFSFLGKTNLSDLTTSKNIADFEVGMFFGSFILVSKIWYVLTLNL